MVRVMKVSIGRNCTDEGRTKRTSIAAATFPCLGEKVDYYNSTVGINGFIKTHFIHVLLYLGQKIPFNTQLSWAVEADKLVDPPAK